MASSIKNEFKKATASKLLKTKGSGVFELSEALKNKYSFSLISAHNKKGRAKDAHEYIIEAKIEDRKKPSFSGDPVRIIAGRKVPTFIPGRQLTPSELYSHLEPILSKKLPASFTLIRVSNMRSMSSNNNKNYFKLTFKCKSVK